MSKYFDELKKVGNRGYTTGFALGNGAGEYSYNLSKGLAGADFLFEFHGKEKINGNELYLVKIKNKILPNDEIEIISPKEQLKAKILGIYDENGFELEVGNTNAEVYLKFDKEVNDYKYAMARTIGIKEYV